MHTLTCTHLPLHTSTSHVHTSPSHAHTSPHMYTPPLHMYTPPPHMHTPPPHMHTPPPHMYTPPPRAHLPFQDQEGLAPLHWAVMSDQATHIRILLISTPADSHIQDKEGRTPLNYAVLNFSPSCIKVGAKTDGKLAWARAEFVGASTQSTRVGGGEHDLFLNLSCCFWVASYPGLLTPAFVTCSTNTGLEGLGTKLASGTILEATDSSLQCVHNSVE